MAATPGRTGLLTALSTCVALDARGCASTLGSWNRITHSSAAVAEEYLASLLAVRVSGLAIIDRIAGRARHVGVATHDAGLAQEAIERLRAAGTPCELEFLVGQPAAHALQMAEAIGAPVRGYVPYGDDATIYGVTRPGRETPASWPRLWLQSAAPARA